jgi:hypothetical protein
MEIEQVDCEELPCQFQAFHPWSDYYSGSFLYEPGDGPNALARSRGIYVEVEANLTVIGSKKEGILENGVSLLKDAFTLTFTNFP